MTARVLYILSWGTLDYECLRKLDGASQILKHAVAYNYGWIYGKVTFHIIMGNNGETH